MATAPAPSVTAAPPVQEPLLQPALRLSGDELRELVQASRVAAAERREAFLKANPGYLPCVVASCTGLVTPRFVRTLPDGRR